MELAPDFGEFIASLTAHGVEFVVVGAYALAFHGAPRFTGDLDILVRPSLENASTGHRGARVSSAELFVLFLLPERLELGERLEVLRPPGRPLHANQRVKSEAPAAHAEQIERFPICQRDRRSHRHPTRPPEGRARQGRSSV